MYNCEKYLPFFILNVVFILLFTGNAFHVLFVYFEIKKLLTYLLTYLLTFMGSIRCNSVFKKAYAVFSHT